METLSFNASSSNFFSILLILRNGEMMLVDVWSSSLEFPVTSTSGESSLGLLRASGLGGGGGGARFILHRKISDSSRDSRLIGSYSGDKRS